MRGAGKEQKKRLGNQGFTMLELLAVFAILAIVAMVAVPRYTKAVEASKVKACETNIEMLTKAAAMYHEIEGEWPDSVEALHTEGYIDEEVKCPLPSEGENEEGYDILDGVVTCANSHQSTENGE
ncbi:MAG: prepilin-type N-terminal cleavage/methylation domain-containing protein [Syntrophomonadaceae bacterium]|nr:prepilin-type N-terminal cleavage/methylation domain-containing protein [Syntrophomonadaceae bacterium]